MSDPDFAARRAAARQRLDAIDPHVAGEGGDSKRQTWFSAVYATANGDEAQVPWADDRPHPLLAEWLARHGATLTGLRALDVGCGLGTNAEAIAATDAHVTAFDLVPAAIAWARQRFPGTRVTYRAADLLALPDEWAGAFDFVHEAYTLQAIAPEIMPDAQAAIARCVAPGGRLLVIARSRADDAPPSRRPPWPLHRTDLERFTMNGLQIESLEAVTRDTMSPHWRALFRRV